MILELFLRENGYSLETLNDLQFRKNNSYVVSANKKGIFPEQVTHMRFLMDYFLLRTVITVNTQGKREYLILL